MFRYDVSAMEPIERETIRRALTSLEIDFTMDTQVLSVVDDDRENQVDLLLDRIAEGIDAAKANAERVNLIRDGRTDLVECEVCGQSPAATIELRRQVGMLIVGTTHRVTAVLCRDCGEQLTKEYQKETAIKGWTSIGAAALNPFTIATNARNQKRHRDQLK